MPYAYMPVSLSLNDANCLVVGGGAVALRKIETLIDYGAKVTVVAPEADDKIKYFGESGRIKFEEREYRSPEAGEYKYVISACDDMAVNKQVSDDCRKGGALVNVVDAPALCDFIFPAVVRRDCLTAAISTDGQAPFMSGHLKKILDDIFPSHWSKLMKLASRFRIMVLERWPDNIHMKTVCYSQFLEGNWHEILKAKDKQLIEVELETMLKPREDKTEEEKEKGKAERAAKPEGEPPIIEV